TLGDYSLPTIRVVSGCACLRVVACSFVVGLLAESITITSTGPFVGTSLSPSCSSIAVTSDGPGTSGASSGTHSRSMSYKPVRFVLSLNGGGNPCDNVITRFERGTDFA